MSDLKPLRCKVCGAPLNPKTLRCSYCGTYHEWERGYNDSITRIQVVKVMPPGSQVLGASMSVPRWDSSYMSPGELERYVKESLTEKISHGLAPYIEFQQDFDIANYADNFTARIRVLEPGFRF